MIFQTHIFFIGKDSGGWLIEPNKELCKLLASFRPKDIVVELGVGSVSAVSQFYVSRTPVGSTFNDTHFHERGQRLHNIRFVPVMRIDKIFPGKTIGVLSIDVEGWNAQALESAVGLLGYKNILCVEYDSEKEKSEFLKLLSEFELIHDSGNNIICIRKSGD